MIDKMIILLTIIGLIVFPNINNCLPAARTIESLLSEINLELDSSDIQNYSDILKKPFEVLDTFIQQSTSDPITNKTLQTNQTRSVESCILKNFYENIRQMTNATYSSLKKELGPAYENVTASTIQDLLKIEEVKANLEPFQNRTLTPEDVEKILKYESAFRAHQKTLEENKERLSVMSNRVTDRLYAATQTLAYKFLANLMTTVAHCQTSMNSTSNDDDVNNKLQKPGVNVAREVESADLA